MVLNAPIGNCLLNASFFNCRSGYKFLEVAGKPEKAILGQFYWGAFTDAKAYYEAALADVVKSGEACYTNEVELMLIRHGREEIIYTALSAPAAKNKDGKVINMAVRVMESTKQGPGWRRIEIARDII